MWKKNTLWLNVISTVVLVLVLYANYYLSPGIRDISHKYSTIITPTDMTFSIWGIIYSFAIWTLIIFWQKSRTNANTNISLIVAYNAVLLLNTLWIFVWLKEYLVLSWIVITAILLILACINYQLIHQNDQSSKVITVFFEIHFAWICAAFFLNTLVVWGFYQGTNLDYGSIMLSVLALVVIAVLANILLFKKNRLYFTMAFLWTLYGILMNLSQDFPLMIQFVRVLFVSQLIVFALKGIIVLIREKEFIKNNNDT